MKKSKLGPVLLLIVATTAIAQVYRWVDEEGGIHFGDKPPEEVDAEELISPEGPPEEEIVQAQEDLRKRLEAGKVADEALESKRRDTEVPALEKAKPKAGIESIRNNELVCFTPLLEFVEGESANRFVPITPTELTHKQQMLLKDRFGEIGRYWRGEIIEVVCTGNPSKPDSKLLEFEAKTVVDWRARQSQLVVKTDSSGKDDRSVEELTQTYKVGDALYFSDAKTESEGWSDIAVKGNKVEILTLERNTLAFLIKRSGPKKRSLMRSEIHHLDLTKNQLLFKEIYFAHDVLAGWKTQVLHK